MVPNMVVGPNFWAWVGLIVGWSNRRRQRILDAGTETLKFDAVDSPKSARDATINPNSRTKEINDLRVNEPQPHRPINQRDA
jgi:hypothetical protein